MASRIFASAASTVFSLRITTLERCAAHNVTAVILVLLQEHLEIQSVYCDAAALFKRSSDARMRRSCSASGNFFRC